MNLRYNVLMRYVFPCLFVLLCACAPRVLTEPPTVIDGAVQNRVAFGAFDGYYETLGAGQPILMIHGIGGGSSLFQYRDNAPALSQAGYQVYALDLLGFGNSDRPQMRYTQDIHVAQIEQFIDTVIGQPAIIVANGLSAAYSIRLAAERPELVEALILIGPTGYDSLAREQNEVRLRQFNRFSGILGSVLYGLLLEEGGQRFFLLDAYIDSESLTDEVLASYDRNLKKPNSRWVVLSFISGNLDQAVAGLWEETTQPSLIVWGEQAQTTPASESAAFLQARPEVMYLELDGAKLLPNEDRADAFNEAVLEFLANVQ